MRKRFLALFLSLALCLSLVPATAAAPAQPDMARYGAAAEALWADGLFLGSGTSFDLDKPLVRSAGMTMVVRLLGAEGEAKAGSYSIPFTDVPDWAKPYVGYAYTKGLTQGTSATTFGSDAPMTAAQFLTLVLRALGYDDKSGDFSWDRATDKAVSIGLIQPADLQGDFLRGHAALISYNALSQNIKGTDKSLKSTIILPSKPAGAMPAWTAVPSTGDAELDRAVSYGFVPADLQGEYGQTITYAQFCAVLDGMLTKAAAKRYAEWTAASSRARGSSAAMTRSDGMLSLLIAGTALDMPTFTARWGDLAESVKNCPENWGFSGSYEQLYPAWQSYTALDLYGDADVYRDMDAAMWYSVRRPSPLSGKPLLEPDSGGNLQVKAPLTRRAAILAAARLYETVVPIVKADAALLPAREKTDYAIYAGLTPGDKITADITFFPQYQISATTTAAFDLILPKAAAEDFRRDARIDVQATVNAAMAGTNLSDGRELPHDDATRGAVTFRDGAPRYEPETGAAVSMEDCGAYYKARIPVTTTFSFPGAATVNLLSLSVELSLPAGSFSGKIYFDNVELSSGGSTLVSYDFERQYGARGEKTMRASVRCTDYDNWALWGDLNRIGTEEADNALRLGLVCDGAPFQPNRADLLAGADPGMALHMPGTDWRNLTGFTFQRGGGIHLEPTMGLTGKIALPKGIFTGFQDQTASFALDLSLRPQTNSGEESEDLMFPDVFVRRNTDGTLRFESGARIGVTEYRDCYLIDYAGKLTTDVGYTDILWIGIGTSGHKVTYNGYWYLADLALQFGTQSTWRYDIANDPLPDDLVGFYDHGTNGSYFYYNALGSGFYHYSFEHLNLK